MKKLLILLLLLIPINLSAVEYKVINSKEEIKLESLDLYDFGINKLDNKNLIIKGLIYNHSASFVNDFELKLFNSKEELIGVYYVKNDSFVSGYNDYEKLITLDNNLDDIYFYTIGLSSGYILDKDDVKDGVSWDDFIYLVPIVFLIMFLIKMFVIDKKKKFNMSDNMNSVEFAYTYNGEFYMEYVYTMIIYLATKGYITIEKTKDNYKINKVKEYDKTNELEKVFMEGVFKRKNLKANNYVVKKNYVCMDEINPNVFLKLFYKVEEKKEKLTKKISGKIMVVMILLGYLSIIINPLYNYYPFYIFVLLVVISSCLLVIVLRLFVYNKLLKLVGVLIGLFFGSSVFIYPAVLASKSVLYFIGGFIGLFLIIILYFVKRKKLNYFAKDTKVISFVETVNNMKASDIKRVLFKEPNYIFNILPYLMVLNTDNKYLDEYRGLLVDMPKWYIDKTNDNKVESFYNFMFVDYENIVNNFNKSINLKK